MSDNQSKKTLHPLMAIAAIAVIIFSLVGVAAMTGLLPGSKSEVKQDSMSNSLTTDVASAQSKDAVETPVQPVASTDNAASRQTSTNSNKTVTARPAEKVREPVKVAEAPRKSICQQCGVVDSITSYEQKAEKGSGIGAVAGAVLGGVIGNQVGGGNGRKLATVAGAVGGGYAGNEIEKSRNTQTIYEVVVKMENGDIRTFKPSNKPEWREGDRVRLTDGRLVSND
jgi:outer membrane lipoprotein SlyB